MIHLSIIATNTGFEAPSARAALTPTCRCGARSPVDVVAIDRIGRTMTATQAPRLRVGGLPLPARTAPPTDHCPETSRAAVAARVRAVADRWSRHLMFAPSPAWPTNVARRIGGLPMPVWQARAREGIAPLAVRAPTPASRDRVGHAVGIEDIDDLKTDVAEALHAI